MKAISYTRVSTTGQVDDGISLEAQAAKITKWCEAQGYELAGAFSDEGVSGKSMSNRPGLQAALKACKRGSVLVCYSISRLCRNTLEMLTLEQDLRKRDVSLVSLSEKFDTSSPSGRLFFEVLSSVASFERAVGAERTKVALQQKRAKGERVGRINYGKQLDSDGIHLVDCQQEQAVLQIIAELRANGIIYRDIADELNRRGIINRDGQAWNHVSAFRVAKNCK